MKQVYEDSADFKKTIEGEGFPDGVYVSINIMISRGRRTDRKGLDYVLQELDKKHNNPIIMYSFEPPFNLFQDKRFMGAMSKKQVHFVRLPFSPNDLKSYLSLPTFDNRALEIYLDNIELENLPGKLRHDYRHRPAESIQLARTKLGYEGTDEEVRQKLFSESKVKLPKQEIGELSGIFVDVEGTLLRDGKLNDGLVRRLIDYSRQYPITLWTGGDLKRIYGEVGGKLREFVDQYNKEHGISTNLHLRTPILSKHSFRSAKPQIVIDDITLEDFKKEFGMEPLNYEQV